MTPDTKVTPEVREAVLSTIQHEAYRTLATFIMDGLTLEQIQAKVGFDELQYKSMVDHIAKISSETVAKPEEEEAPKVATPEVVSSSEATNIPVEGAQTGVGQIHASGNNGGNDVPKTQPEGNAVATAYVAPVADVLNAPEASQPQPTGGEKTEELTA